MPCLMTTIVPTAINDHCCHVVGVFNFCVLCNFVTLPAPAETIAKYCDSNVCLSVRQDIIHSFIHSFIF